MTPALVLRTRFASEMGRPCCSGHLRFASADAMTTARMVHSSLGVHAKGDVAKAPRIEERMGLRIVEYLLSIAVSGREWAGSGMPKDAELTNPANWRVV